MQCLARARVALATHTVREAVAHGFRREMYVATPVGATTLEGYVDLVYRDDDGLVVVDYKTDAHRPDEDLAPRLTHYRIQGAAYALAVADATGEAVARCVFCFLDPAGAREVTVTGADLAAAIAEVRGLVRREWESPSPPEPAVPAEL
jgi:ATP-dependent helicase/nuclease subunit A